MNRISIFFTTEKPIANRLLVPLMVLGVLSFAPPLVAAEAELTLSQAIERSLTQHPQIKAQAYRTQSAQAQVRQAEVRRGTEIQLQQRLTELFRRRLNQGAGFLSCCLFIRSNSPDHPRSERLRASIDFIPDLPDPSNLNASPRNPMGAIADFCKPKPTGCNRWGGRV